MPLGTEKVSLLAASAGGATNYFGDSSDGSVTTSGDVTYTVLNKVGSYDGDMVISQYSALTISAGDTVTVDQSCRGMFIYVAGNCTIDGTLSMSQKGGYSDPTSSGGSDSNAVGTNGLQIGLRTASGTDTFTNDGTGFNGAGTAVKTAIANEDDIAGDGTTFSIQKALTSGTAPSGAVTISPGRGGTGFQGSGGTSGRGGYAGAFSGGAGAGGVWCAAPASCSSTAGGDYGGAGGAAGGTGGQLGGGAGNPGGGGVGGGSTGSTGVGGIIWLVVKGSLTIASGGSIVAIGAAGGGENGGGGSGGGAIHILHGGTFTNSGSISVTGGAGGGNGAGAGLDGGTNTAQVAAA